MKLRLVKIEEGLCRGNVVYHAHQTKTPAEIKKQLDSLKSKKELKEKRKRIQEENVRRKAEKKQQGEKEELGEKYEFEKDEEGNDQAEANVDDDKDTKAKTVSFDTPRGGQ